MLKVIIKSIERKHVLKDAEYEWVMEHLNVPLQVSSISFDDDTGKIWCIVVRHSEPVDADGSHVIVLFVSRHSNNIKYEFCGALPQRS